MVDVFISYSRANQDVVQRLAAAVTAEGYSVWWDADLPPHRSYGEVITEQISTAKAAIVVWSRDAAASEWVRAEADVARGQKKLIQTSIDGQMPPMPFNQIQFASIGDWRGEPEHPGWRKVKASLAILCGKAEAGAAPPMPPQHVAPAPPPYHPPAPHSYHPPAPPPYHPAGRHGAAPAGGHTAQVVGLTLGAVLLLGALATGGYFLMRGDGTSRVPVAVTNQVVDPGARGTPSEPPARPIAGRPAATPDPAPGPSTPAPAATGDLIFPDSDQRLLSRADLAGLTRQQLRIARNEIYARRGRRFRDPALREYFSRFGWYRPISDEVRLSQVEAANVRLLQMAENAR